MPLSNSPSGPIRMTRTARSRGTPVPLPSSKPSISSIVRPHKKAQSRQAIRPRTFQRSNPVTEILSNHEREMAAAATRASGAGLQCPNKSCSRPNVIDGVCRSCGRVADETNIVSEIQFSEGAGGANVAQGTLFALDQAGPRMYGLRRFGGATEERERSIREARQFIQGWADQLNISESIVNSAVQVYKLASSANFIQGRTQIMVAGVCLYAACRNDPPCKIMLIDIADMTQINVFKLGRTYKALNRAVPMGSDGICPVYPEDLMWRFASRLEFLDMTNKVAEDAIRLVRRMKQDWLVMGRRPSGICGAALLMAARMNNFRRTVREVVYIVKVTTHTIQCRLDEFQVTESSNMTVEDFLTQDFLESSHDPPSFYKKSAEWKEKVEEKRRNRKRKRQASDADGDEADGEAPVVFDLEAQSASNTSATQTLASSVGGSASSAAKSAATQATPASTADTSATSAPSAPDLSALPVPEYPRDADGFVIPLTASQQEMLHQREIVDPKYADKYLNRLAADFGDSGPQTDDGTPPPPLPPPSQGTTQAVPPGDKGKNTKRPELPITEEWEMDEEELEEEVSEMISDPHTQEHALAFDQAQQRAELHKEWAHRMQPQRDVPMDETVGEDEFANDPEVSNCALRPEELPQREQMWVKNNARWLRENQERIFQRKMNAGRPKATRRRRKKPRIGEGQTTPASTPGEAAVNAMKVRAFSTRINYDAILDLLDGPNTPGGPGSSKPTSYAGSVAGGDDGAAGQAAAAAAAASQADPDEFEEEEDDEDDDDDDFEGGYEDYDDNVDGTQGYDGDEGVEGYDE